MSLAAGYTHQHVEYKDRVRSGSGYLSSNIIGYRDYGDKYTFNAEYAISVADLLLGYNLLFFNSKNVASAASDEKTKVPGYAVHDLYVTYAPDSGRFKGLEINAGVYNLFDKAYASHSQRSTDFTGDSNAIDWEPGRNFKLSVAYKF